MPTIKKSFQHERYRNSTELSKYVWNMKEKEETFELAWKIEERARPYNAVTKRCNLCLAEKARIITSNKAETIN